MNAKSRRTALALTSFFVSVAIAIPVVSSRLESDGGTVEIVDKTEEAHRLLTDAAARERDARADPADDTEESAGWVTRHLPEEDAPTFFPSIDRPGWDYDPQAYFVRAPSQRMSRRWAEHSDGSFEIRINDYGMREDEDIALEQPPARIIVLGDSHVSGVVPNCESMPNVLEARLAQDFGAGVVDVLNAGCGAYNVYNYVGSLDRLAHLRPDVVIVVLYGGNDFYSTAKLQRYFERRGPWSGTRIPTGQRRDAWDESSQIRAQESNQLRYFHDNPEDVEVAVATTRDAIEYMRMRCEEISSTLVVAYLPPAMAAQPTLYSTEIELTRVALGPEASDVQLSDRIADDVLAYAAAQGVPVVDLRPRFRADPRPMFWFKDYHINTDAHAVAAEELLPLARALVGARIGSPSGRSNIKLDLARDAEVPWAPSDAAVAFREFQGVSVVLFPRSEDGADVTAEVDVGRVRTAVVTAMSDGPFTLRVDVGRQRSSPVTSSATNRQWAAVRCPIPRGPERGHEAIEIRIRVESNSAPVAVSSVTLEP